MATFRMSLFASSVASCASSASCDQSGRCSRPKGLYNKAAFLPDGAPCLLVRQRPWLLRGVFWRHGPRQDEVTAACRRRGAPFIRGADPHLLPRLPSQHRGIPFGEPCCQWLWLNFKNADKAERLGAMVFECLARRFVGLDCLIY